MTNKLLILSCLLLALVLSAITVKDHNTYSNYGNIHIVKSERNVLLNEKYPTETNKLTLLSTSGEVS
jgi:hypothetical protein